MRDWRNDESKRMTNACRRGEREMVLHPDRYAARHLSAEEMAREYTDERVAAWLAEAKAKRVPLKATGGVVGPNGI